MDVDESFEIGQESGNEDDAAAENLISVSGKREATPEVEIDHDDEWYEEGKFLPHF